MSAGDADDEMSETWNWTAFELILDDIGVRVHGIQRII